MAKTILIKIKCLVMCRNMCHFAPSLTKTDSCSSMIGGIGGKCQVPPAPNRREELKEIVHASGGVVRDNNIGNTYCGEPEADGMSARLPALRNA